jgi:hypothetical protein
MRLRRVPTLLLALLVAAASAASLVILKITYRGTPVSVTIDAPGANSHIDGCRVKLRGRVSPGDTRLALAVRSERDDGWWIQPYVVADSGNWMVEALLGTDTEGIDQNFIIVALASADPLIIDVLTGRHVWPRRDASNAQVLGCPPNYGSKVSALPPVAKSRPTAVRRVRR